MNSPWHMQRMAEWHRVEIEQDIESVNLGDPLWQQHLSA